jgi:hypothetical protein
MVICAGALGIVTQQTFAGVVVDFSVDDNSNALVNGQIIDTEFFTNFTISSPDTGISHAGLAIFDSDPAGPNFGGGDPDLLVNLGNVLIMQNNNGSFGNNNGSIFFTPDDEADFNPTGEGNVVFNFNSAVQLQSIDLIDINGGVLVDVVMTDGNGLQRTYNVPNMWTHDIDITPAADGYATLDLTSLAPQNAEGTGGSATAFEDAGFDANDVVSLSLRVYGNSPSMALDNLVYQVVPGPGALAMLALGLPALRRRRRIA